MLNAVRRVLLPPLDPLARRAGRPLIRQKYTDEYVCSVVTNGRRLERALAAHGYSANPFSTLKYVVDGDTRCYEVGTMVYRPTPLAHEQFHVYYFAAADDYHDVHVHQHRETSWLRHPIAHMGPGQDPTDKHLWTALQAADVDASRLDDPQYEPS